MSSRKLKLVVPKGHMFGHAVGLLAAAGLRIEPDERSYRPRVSDADVEVKILKAANIPRLVELGSHDLGLSGHDWVVESDAGVVELLDLELDPVRLVAAIPRGISERRLAGRRLIVASEYERIATRWLRSRGYDFVFVRTYGATEVYPPEDADMIIDNSATGATLEQNGLQVIAEILRSSTRLIANRDALASSWKKRRIDELVLLLRSVLAARDRVMLEMNVPENRLAALIRALPAMKSPTVAKLYGDQGYAVKAAVPRADVPRLVPRLKQLGATDIVEYELGKVVP